MPVITWISKQVNVVNKNKVQVTMSHKNSISAEGDELTVSENGVYNVKASLYVECNLDKNLLFYLLV